MFAGNFAIRNTALCNGQLMAISQNTALFSILGTNYGGNGQTTFGLPNLMGKCPIHVSDTHPLGEIAGTEMVTLLQTEMPTHDHGQAIQAAIGTGGAAVTATAVDSLPGTTTATALYTSNSANTFMTPLNTNVSGPTSVAGSTLPHNNMQPYLAVNFLIALTGIFPARN
ncbi:Phage Tail Collar Domain protein [compost metagenome]